MDPNEVFAPGVGVSVEQCTQKERTTDEEEEHGPDDCLPRDSDGVRRIDRQSLRTDRSRFRPRIMRQSGTKDDVRWCLSRPRRQVASTMLAKNRCGLDLLSAKRASLLHR